MIESLKELGLKEIEAQIYLKLIKRGDLTAVEIAKEVKTHRRTIYDNLNILINKGLVTFFLDNNVKYFQAINPEILKRIQEEKTKELDKILPKLSSFYADQKTDPKVSVLKGLNSAKSILIEMMKSKKEIYWMGGGFQIINSLGYSENQLLSTLSKLNLKIIQPTPDNSSFKKYFKKNNLKFISKKYQSKSSFFVYDDTVIIGSLLNDDAFTIKIECPEIAKTYINYFDIIWNSY